MLRANISLSLERETWRGNLFFFLKRTGLQFHALTSQTGMEIDLSWRILIINVFVNNTYQQRRVPAMTFLVVDSISADLGRRLL